MDISICDEHFELAELFGKPVLYSNTRIDRDTVPEGIYAYDLRHGDDPGLPLQVEPFVAINHAGTIICTEPIEFGETKFIDLKGSLNFHGECRTFEEFMEDVQSNGESQSVTMGGIS